MNFNAPINSVSFGNVSYALLREFIASTEPLFFPIGGMDFSVFSETDQKLNQQIVSLARSSKWLYSRKEPSLKLWHINGSEESISDKRALLTFHETDRLTDVEKNILSQNDLVFVTSKYTQEVFQKNGIHHTRYVPLGFDEQHFGEVPVPKDGVIKFLLSGKLENRKNTLRILSLWAKKFGGDKRFALLCQITNPHINPDVQKIQISQALGGKQYFNISFLPFLPKIELFNKLINAVDIDLTGMSSCEGFNLPAFHSLALGKWGIFLNAHVHKDYADETNSILVNPTGMRPAEDGVFFRNGADFNQGNWFDFSDDEFVSAMEKAVDIVQISPSNINGKKLREKFTYKKSANQILSDLEDVFNEV